MSIKLIVFVCSTLLLSLTAQARSFCEGQRVRTAAEQIASFDPSVDLDLVDYDIFSGGNISAGYEYEVEPAYSNGLYARTDRWQINTSLVPTTDGELSGGHTWSAGIGAKHGAEATFIRFFKNACQAEIALPYTPRRVPLKATAALSDKFQRGEYFVFKASLGFVVSADMLKLLGTPLWGVRASASYLLQGSYQIHIVRQDDDHVRLKIIARRGKEIGAGLNVGWSGEFDVFGVSQLDRQLRRIVDPEPLKVSYNDTNARVFIVDYTLNLRDPAVADAYDKVLRQTKYFKSLQLASPFSSKNEIENKIIMDLAPLEDIFRADHDNNNVARIRRTLRSTSDQDGARFSLDIGNRLLGFEFDATTAASRISIREPNDSITRYLLRSYDRTYDGRVGYSWSRLFTKKGVEVLLKSVDSEFEQLEAINIVQNFERKDSRLRKKEFKDIRLQMKKALPDFVYTHIPFDAWQQGDKDILRNFGMRYQLVLGPEVVFNTPELTPDEIVTLFKNYLYQKGLTATDYFVDGPRHDRGGIQHSAQFKFDSALGRIGKKLSQAVDTKRSHNERLQAFMDLRKNTVFSQSGIGFLMYLQPEQTYRLDLNLSANDRQLDFVRGDESTATFYRKILLIKEALEDEGLDLRRTAESLKL
ncbi:MAG: hypothetical protein ACLGG0_06495 [Bacteriovoracia bacterium]